MAKDFRTNVEVTGTLLVSSTASINSALSGTSGAFSSSFVTSNTVVTGQTPANLTSRGSTDFSSGDMRFLSWGAVGTGGTFSWWTGTGNSGATQRMSLSNTGALIITGNLTASAGTTTLGTTNTGIITSTGSIQATSFHANSNGAATNFRVGDDVWIGDINLADTMSIRGISGASSNGYIRFGSDTNSLGYNGSIFSYAQGIVFSPQMVRLDSNRTKPTNDTSLEPIFDAANDTISIDAGSLYYFKGIFQISKTATGTNAGIQLGFAFSNSPQNINYKYSSHTQAIGTVQGGLGTVNTATTVTATGTGAANYVIQIEGWFKSNATTGGTFAPTFTQSVAGTSAAPTANANSWFRIQKMSSTVTTTNITGGWS